MKIILKVLLLLLSLYVTLCIIANNHDEIIYIKDHVDALVWSCVGACADIKGQ